MDWRDWIIAGAVVTFAGGQIVPPYTHPLDSKKHSHTHIELGYTHVGTSGDTVIVLTTGDPTITPKTGSLVTVGEGVKVELRSSGLPS